LPRTILLLHQLRALWYILSSAVEEEETQIKGFVGIGYFMGYDDSQDQEHNQRPPMDRLAGYYAQKVFGAIPIRMEAFHYCCQHVPTMLVVKLVLLLTNSDTRIRTRCYCGTYVRVCNKQYDLIEDRFAPMDG
jgi:hypothetical protein